MGIASALAVQLPGCGMEMESRMVRVSRTEFGEAWPLTVPWGRVSCKQNDVLTFQWKGTEYALTSTATHGAYSDITPIRADAGAGVGKKDLEPLIRLGRELCE